MWHCTIAFRLDVADPSHDGMWQLTVYYLTHNFIAICGSGAGLTKLSCLVSACGQLSYVESCNRKQWFERPKGNMNFGIRGLVCSSSMLSERRPSVKMPPGLQIRQAYWLLELNVINGACFELTRTVWSYVIVVLHRLQGVMGVKSLCNHFFSFWHQIRTG